jgi:O-antigen ligase
MQLEFQKKRVANLVPLGAFLTTVFILTGSVSDPVNLTKLLIVGAFAGAIGLALGFKGFQSAFREAPLFNTSILVFLVLATFSTILSEAPLVQNLYGVYGRNNGLIMYFAMGIFAIASSILSSKKHLEKILISFALAGAVNLIYGAWVAFFGDFIAWNNIYGNLLGTFGNPNFMGSFLGMLFGIILAYTVAPTLDIKLRLVGFFLLGLTFFEITETSAVQGVVLSGGAIFLCGFFWIWKQLQNKVLLLIYSLLGSILGLLATLGALQIGPLTSLVYKRSVSLRGAYWNAGIETGMNNLVSGAGMDSFGNWYRRTRSLNAVTDTPGAEVTTNAAHNVPIDFFANGGIPLALAYLVLTIATLVSIYKISMREKKYDPLTVALIIGWICYQTQSIISINQIGLAIWGWVFSGAIIALERLTRTDTDSENISNKVTLAKSKQKKNISNFDATGLRALLGMAIGITLFIPPFSADLSYQTALNSRNVVALEKSLEGGYFKPTDSFRLANAVQIFERSNLPELALKYARFGVDFNPDFTDAWKLLYYVTGATTEEKQTAKEQLIRLDPLNKAWKELP